MSVCAYNMHKMHQYYAPYEQPVSFEQSHCICSNYLVWLQRGPLSWHKSSADLWRSTASSMALHKNGITPVVIIITTTKACLPQVWQSTHRGDKKKLLTCFSWLHLAWRLLALIEQSQYRLLSIHWHVQHTQLPLRLWSAWLSLSLSLSLLRDGLLTTSPPHARLMHSFVICTYQEQQTSTVAERPPRHSSWNTTIKANNIVC